MAFPAQPLDGSGVPIACTYVPNSVFNAIQASTRTKMDTLSNTYTTPIFELRTQEDIRTGLAYSATSGVLATATNPSIVVGASLFNPAASGKTVLVWYAKVVQQSASTDARLYLTTVDPQLGAPTALTPANMLAGGSTSTLAGLSPYPITSVDNGITAPFAPARGLI